jgi:hypothetical protein
LSEGRRDGGTKERREERREGRTGGRADVGCRARRAAAGRDRMAGCRSPRVRNRRTGQGLESPLAVTVGGRAEVRPVSGGLAADQEPG